MNKKDMRVRHSKALQDIVKDPHIIGFTDVERIDIEKPFRNSNGIIIGEADLIIHKRGLVYVAEYKCTDYNHGRIKAEVQLMRASFGIPITYGLEVKGLLYIHGKFNVERLKEGQWEWFK